MDMNDFFRLYNIPGIYQDLTDETFQDDDSQNIGKSSSFLFNLVKFISRYTF